MAQVIIIEGQIGVGKTTLSRELAKALGGRLFPEPVVENPYLEDYYRAPAQHALPMQLWLLDQRYRAQLEAQYCAMRGTNAVLDRSYYGDVSFALVQKKMGYMRPREMDTYLALYESMSAHVLFPNVCIYLKIEPLGAVERIKARGRDCEEGVPLGYLQALDSEIKEMVAELRENNVTVIDVDYNDPMEIGGVQKLAVSLAEKIKGLESPFLHDRLVRRK